MPSSLLTELAGTPQNPSKLPPISGLLQLPPYSPERNPQENIWQYLRQNALANRAYETYDNIVSACCKAWNDLIDLPETIKSIASREWFQCVSSIGPLVSGDTLAHTGALAHDFKDPDKR